MYFSASRSVSLMAVFDKVRGQLPEKLLLTTEITTYSVHDGRARTAHQLSCGMIVRAYHMSGDGRDVFQREQKCYLDKGIRQSARSTA